MEGSVESKLQRLKEIISELESVLIAFSGGVDSTFLTRIARDILGERVIAVTAISPAYPRREIDEAIAIAQEIRVKHLLIESGELNIAGFSENRPDRCYYCKSALFERLRDLANRYGMRYVLDGSNYDDIGDYRPGGRAAREKGIRSPLCEAGLRKEEIRILSRDLGLRTWNKPSFACLSSRIPYNERITIEKLRQIEMAEDILRNLGFSQIRVRHHNEIARIEILSDEFPLILDSKKRATIIEKFKVLGFLYITLDLMGYRTGSMNEVLSDASRIVKKNL